TPEEILQIEGDRIAMRLNAKQEPAVRIINGVLFAALAGDFEKLQRFFDIDGAIQKDSWSASLKSRTPELTKIIRTVSLEGGAYVRQVIIVEASGDRTKIIFSGIETGDSAMSADEAASF